MVYFLQLLEYESIICITIGIKGRLFPKKLSAVFHVLYASLWPSRPGSELCLMAQAEC